MSSIARAALLAVLLSQARALGVTGGVIGRVIDQDDGLVPGTAVTLVPSGGMTSRIVVTNAARLRRGPA